MAFQDLRSELRGSVPKLPFAFTGTLINRAYKLVRESHLWSFNIFDGAWITPPLVNAGTCTATLGLNTVTFDATATAALNAASAAYSLITQRQFRIGIGGIYNIIAWDSPSSTATLDRVFADPSAISSAYQIYQTYYTAPMPDFLGWISVRNMQLFMNLNLLQQGAWVDAQDPQRSWYQFPSHVIPWGTDLRSGSPTLGYPIFELWGQAITPYTYQSYGLRRGVDLVNPGDTLPMAVGEDLILAKAKVYAYEWAEANKDLSKAASPDFKFLMGSSEAEFKRLLINYRRQDKELLDNHFFVKDPAFNSFAGQYYNSQSGFAGSRG